MSKEVNAGFDSSNVISLLASLHALNVRSIIAISNVMELKAKPLEAFVGIRLSKAGRDTGPKRSDDCC